MSGGGLMVEKLWFDIIISRLVLSTTDRIIVMDVTNWLGTMDTNVRNRYMQSSSQQLNLRLSYTFLSISLYLSFF